VDDPSFEILLIGYAIESQPVEVIDLAQGESLPQWLKEALTNPAWLKTAHNANFERTCFAKCLGVPMPPEQWECSAVRAATLGLPRSLEDVGEVLDLGEDEKKMREGKALINYFCKPCSPTKANGGRTRNYPRHDMAKWDLFKAYNKQDVVTERAILEKLSAYPKTTQVEEHLWDLDQKINDHGVLVEKQLVDNIINFYADHKDRLIQRAIEISGIDNPGSIPQVRRWLASRGFSSPSLDKDAVKDLVKTVADKEVLEFLRIYQELGKTSVEKYEALNRSMCHDTRIRGTLMFYGANRSGRWSGRIFQPQNLPQNKMKDIDTARSIVMDDNFELLEMLYDSPTEVFSQLVRTALISEPGRTFTVADYSAIEARVLSWLADEQWRLDVFATHGKIYEATASKMFKIPIEQITKESPYRKKGKVSELACIAEGTLITTNKGLVPIEHITTDMLLWDGDQFVKHDGVIYKGIKEVITYDGLTATKDHLVWVEGEDYPIPMGQAAESGSRLAKSKPNWHDLWKCKNNQLRETIHKGLDRLLRIDRMHPLSFKTVDPFGKFNTWSKQRLSKMFTTETSSSMALQEGFCSKATMHESKMQELWHLRGAGYQVQFPKRSRSLPVSDGTGELQPRPLFGIRPDRQQWPLRKREPSICSKRSELIKSECNRSSTLGSKSLALCAKCCNQKTVCGKNPRRDYSRSKNCSGKENKELESNSRKVRVYDILNCGPRNCYTASGVLVHNCGYQGGAGAYERMGAKDMGLSDAEVQNLVNSWREANPNIVRYWGTVEDAMKSAIMSPGFVVKVPHGIEFQMISDTLFIKLPSGRQLAYKDAVVVKVGFRQEIRYQGQNQQTGKWETTSTYGGKITENICQAVARDCLGWAMLALDANGYTPLFHVHDEVIISVDDATKDADMKLISDLMAKQYDWQKGLILRADAYQTKYYLKD
jgi:DNA polymerase